MAITPSSFPWLLHLSGTQSVFRWRADPSPDYCRQYHAACGSYDRRPIYLDSALTTQRNNRSMSVGQPHQLQQRQPLAVRLACRRTHPKTEINRVLSLRSCNQTKGTHLFFNIIAAQCDSCRPMPVKVVSFCYSPQMRHRNTFSRVCLSVMFGLWLFTLTSGNF